MLGLEEITIKDNGTFDLQKEEQLIDKVLFNNQPQYIDQQQGENGIPGNDKTLEMALQ